MDGERAEPVKDEVIRLARSLADADSVSGTYSGLVRIRGYRRHVGGWREGVLCANVARIGESPLNVNCIWAAEEAEFETSEASVGRGEHGRNSGKPPDIK